MHNLLIGGAAGMGIETTAEIMEKTLKRAGFYVLSVRDVMSRVRGGHNFITIRFGNEPILSHHNVYDVVAAFDQTTLDEHTMECAQGGTILCDSKWKSPENAIMIPFAELASSLGNARTAGTIIAGALLGLFQIDPVYPEQVLEEVFRKELLDVNKKALQTGYEQIQPKYELHPAQTEDHMILSGNQAIGIGAIAAGVNFYSAYPMSPSTSIMEYLASVGERAGIVVEQAEDEIAGINMALGASYAGARAMTGTSGGGFCLKVEAIGFSGIAEIPLVAVDVMRPGPATGLPTRTEQSDLKFVISAAQGEFQRMVIAVRDHQDAILQTYRAFQMAEKYQIPVILLSDQYLADSHGMAVLPDFDKYENHFPLLSYEGEPYLRYKITDSGVSPRLVPGKTKEVVCIDSDEHNEKGWIIESAEERVVMADKRERKMSLLKEELLEPDYSGVEEPEILLVAWGSLSGPVKEAVSLLNQEGLKVGTLVFGDVFPLPEVKITEYAKKVKKMINVEQNATGQLAGLIREYTGLTMAGSVLKYDGRQLSGTEIAEKIRTGGWA